ncbi:MAG: J domain-containing protein [Gammaproteobacteria bacterium]|nr:J domain-containing protein [Gammaproteobacteria bacterium]
MTSDVTASPLSWPAGWPRTPSNKRKRAAFGKRKESSYSWTDGNGQKCTYTQKGSLTVAEARDRLLFEIRSFTRSGRRWRINPDMVVISTDLRLRNDGFPRSGQREPEDPGVAVYFELDGQPQVIAMDGYDRIADNIAAVAATLSAMRTIERHGGGLMERAFTGFQALPDLTSTAVAHWRVVLGLDLSDGLAEAEAAYRRLRSKHHPDNGGDATSFAIVQRAIEQARQEIREHT